ncbi:PBP1A family penicillin-binding protein [Patescibacteria group bacterium]|nr:PBP1A family penicillin-binding protein [Patescibacteria group bacterium]
MVKRPSQRDYKTNKTNVLALIFLLPILFLKWIGDLIIFPFKKIPSLVYKTYIILGASISKILILLKLSLAKIKFKPPAIKVKPQTKPVIIFRKRHTLEDIRDKISILQQKINSFRIPWPSMQKSIKIKRAIKLLIIKIKYFFLGALAVAIIATALELNSEIQSLPNPIFLSNRAVPTTTKIYDRNGKLLYEIYADENRTPVKLSEVPLIVKEATVAVEDKGFYNHGGFSIPGIVRAALHDINSSNLEGGSTITQQLVRSALLTPEKTFERKLKEIVLSVWAEQIYSKDQILEMYLNQVPYGGTAWGIEAASETYFGKKVQNLTLPQAALIAGLPAAPTLYSPFGTRPELAKVRQEEVLDEMVKSGYISAQEAQQAKNEPLNLRKPSVPIAAPHFVMYVKDLLEEQYGPRLVEMGGLRVTTTLDLSIQEMAQKIVTNNIENLKSLNVGNGAVLITDPKNGQILAMVGSANYFDKNSDGNVNLTTALRQPGSSIKVVNYAKALSMGYTAATIINDSPVTFTSPGAPSYSPVNYDGKFHGNVPLRVALASSFNIPAVKVLTAIGVKNMIEQGKLMGITTWNNDSLYGLSLTLGAADVTMIDMTKVYGTLADNGIKHDLTPFLKIENYRGEILPSPITDNETQAVSPGISFILSSILSDNNARIPAFGPNSSLVIPGKTVAVKTGTSDNKRDNWTIGYTPDYVVAAWVGNNDNSPMNPLLTSGITGAAPIWHDIMVNLLSNTPDKPFSPPSDIISIPCYGHIEYFIQGTEPKGGCILPPTNIPKPTDKQ